jgi:SAM-dependent methyltransferase
VISDRLLTLVRCPDCRHPLVADAKRDTHEPADVKCSGCGRSFPGQDRDFLDLRPSTAFSETTKYLDEALHADARHESVSPPLLSAAIRNDMLRSFLAPEPLDLVVDLGCGSGRAMVWNAFGGHRVGIDVSPFFSAEARQTVDLVVADLRRLPLADGAVDKAFSLDVLEHLSREGVIDTMNEIGRVLVPGGTFFVYTHSRKNSRLALWLRAVNRFAGYLDRIGVLTLSQERLRKSDHLNPLEDANDFEQVASSAGFRIVRIRYYTPFIGAVVENLFVRLAEAALARRAARRQRGTRPASTAELLRASRLEARRRINRKGPTYLVLRALTWLMKLDIVLFGRIRSGPFFALLRREGKQGVGSSSGHCAHCPGTRIAR